MVNIHIFLLPPHRIMSSYVIDCLPPPTVWSINCLLLLLPMNVLQHVFRPYIDGLYTVYVYLLISNPIVLLWVPLPIDSLPTVSPYLLISLYLLLMFYPLSYLTYTRSASLPVACFFHWLVANKTA
jgi:hypothetical protein